MEASQTNYGPSFQHQIVSFPTKKLLCPCEPGSLASFLATSASARYSTLVDQTISIYREMVEVEGWKGQSKATVKNFRRLPVRVSGFYFRLSFPSKMIGLPFLTSWHAWLSLGVDLGYLSNMEKMNKSSRPSLQMTWPSRNVSEWSLKPLFSVLFFPIGSINFPSNSSVYMFLLFY